MFLNTVNIYTVMDKVICLKNVNIYTVTDKFYYSTPFKNIDFRQAFVFLDFNKILWIHPDTGSYSVLLHEMQRRLYNDKVTEFTFLCMKKEMPITYYKRRFNIRIQMPFLIYLLKDLDFQFGEVGTPKPYKALYRGFHFRKKEALLIKPELLSKVKRQLKVDKRSRRYKHFFFRAYLQEEKKYFLENDIFDYVHDLINIYKILRTRCYWGYYILMEVFFLKLELILDLAKLEQRHRDLIREDIMSIYLAIYSFFFDFFFIVLYLWTIYAPALAESYLEVNLWVF
ncbi:MAG: hypothetical protein NXI18_20585 [Alphaproteobacteria bacterium]|nr:hypothetical protein [Alphaproteobacteria bacterium]